MYHLRRLIRDGEIDVDVGLRAVKSKMGEDLESLMHEALQSKWPEDGQNLLMYAAAQGNEAWFIHLASDIRSMVCVGRHEECLDLLDFAFAFSHVDPGETFTRFPGASRTSLSKSIKYINMIRNRRSAAASMTTENKLAETSPKPLRVTCSLTGSHKDA